MLIRFHRLNAEFELHFTQVFARIPYVGELFACPVHGMTFSPWRDVVAMEERHQQQPQNA